MWKAGFGAGDIVGGGQEGVLALDLVWGDLVCVGGGGD